MTTVSPVTTTSTSARPAATTEAAKVTSDYDTFLKMLTVQMQNQDPLNPIDSTDYAVQLATFSGVEQQVRTNQLLEGLQSGFQSGLADLAGWIGKEARTTGPVAYQGAPVTVLTTPLAGATQATLVVRDAQGAVLAREEIPPGATSYQWLGADATGTPLPPGAYALSVESKRGEEAVVTKPVEHYARVTEARIGTDGTRLVLENGIEVPASSVTGLREAQG
jgi:flagellar basal-body rod modification protein FlgD